MKFYYTIIFAFCLNIINAQESEFVKRFKSATPNELDTIKFSKLSISELEILTNYSIALLGSNIDSVKFKGDVSLSVLFSHLCNGIKDSKYNKNENTTKQLLNKYKEYQYYCQIRPPEWLKLSHYICQGKYEYIYSRLQTTWYFYPLLILSISFFVMYFLFLFKVLKWKYRKHFLWIMSIFFLLLMITFVFFKFSCENYVTEDSFYNISI